MLEDLLKNKQGFKLVCGAGNEDAIEVENLVRLYSMAGCRFFDVCAKPEIVDAAKKGLLKSESKEDKYICVSVGIDGDPHITKAEINYDKCLNCGKCKTVCNNDAIAFDEKYKIINEKCLGWSICAKKCPNNAISMHSQLVDYDKVLPELIKKGIDCIEFHAITTDEKDVHEKWRIINKLFNGMVCISLDRSELGDKKLIERVKRLLETRKPYSTIIQADGIAMSGNDNALGTTLQAVATAQLFQNANLPAYIMMSGGTNSQSALLAKNCDVRPHCIAVGSYARKIVKEYLNNPNLFDDKLILNEAILVAKNLIKSVMDNLKDD